MLASNTKDVAAEFLFIICKRSVSRMIKYVGFGHSAGHLANCGLLGQINAPKHASDSEDSETEEYNAVRNTVNPVTGAVYPPEHGHGMDGMSEEQKQYEAIQLVQAMDKLMASGIVKPGTIGEDGKVREVSHVLELIKNAPENSDSDSD
uniref:Synembryn-A n=1 Tax=Caenorhabditis japonica TaxID=281687 RepID=A0A8R1EH87_CAEJA